MTDSLALPSHPHPTPAPAVALFEPLEQRSLTLRNRIVISPMCQYSCVDGFASDWHLVHLGSRAVGGAAVVIAEATAVTPEGRISPQDLGIWSDAHGAPLARAAAFVEAQGAIPAIQLAHAGRKASMRRPWEGTGTIAPDAGGWIPVAPTDESFGPRYPTPRGMNEDDIARAIDGFACATRRAVDAGFRLIEIHAAHGYLINQFLSPLVNRRSDGWGGSFENRTRLALEVTRAVRAAMPDELPLWMRISATDWAEGGWDLDQSVRLARLVRDAGVDLVDCSSGGAVHWQKVDVAPGYQAPFAERIRRDAEIRTGAVGLITDPRQAEAIVRGGQADIVLIARESLRRPYWPLHAARELGVDVAWPPQYQRAKP